MNTLNSNTKRLVIILAIAISSIMGACTKQDGTDAINKALLTQSTIEQSITGHFCDADNVLSSCP